MSAVRPALFGLIAAFGCLAAGGAEGAIAAADQPDSTSTPSAASFPFSRPSTFVRLSLDIPLNFTTVYGKVEPANTNSEWFLLFEVDHSLIPATFPAINEEIQAGDPFDRCRHFEAVREVEFELEIHSKYVRIRAGNAERYDFPEPLALGNELFAEFFVQELPDGVLCRTAVRVEQKEQSRFSIIKPTAPYSFAGGMDEGVIDPLAVDQRPPSRRMLPPTTPSSRQWTGRVRFATYKMQHRSSRITMKPVDGKRPNYIDIQKDRAVYEEVQRSRTKEINSAWSFTFIFFLTVEIILIGAFVLFGLIMFVVLQIRPRGKDKFVAMID